MESGSPRTTTVENWKNLPRRHIWSTEESKKGVSAKVLVELSKFHE